MFQSEMGLNSGANRGWLEFSYLGHIQEIGNHLLYRFLLVDNEV